MNYDQYGQCWTTCDELFTMLYKNPDLKLDQFLVKIGSGEEILLQKYNDSVDLLYADMPKLKAIRPVDSSIEEFDSKNQSTWHMPQDYKDLDIAEWILNQCKHDYELQRVGQELLMFQERDLFNLLRYLKYLVDTLRKNNIVWGVGRGSSVSSYVLYLIGVHKIDSLYYELSIDEFLK